MPDNSYMLNTKERDRIFNLASELIDLLIDFRDVLTAHECDQIQDMSTTLHTLADSAPR